MVDQQRYYTIYSSVLFYFIFNILFNYRKYLFHTTRIGVIKKVGFCDTNYAFVVTMTSTTSFCLRGP